MHLIVIQAQYNFQFGQYSYQQEKWIPSNRVQPMKTITIKLSELETIMLKSLSSKTGSRGDLVKTIRLLIEDEYKEVFRR